MVSVIVCTSFSPLVGISSFFLGCEETGGRNFHCGAVQQFHSGHNAADEKASLSKSFSLLWLVLASRAAQSLLSLGALGLVSKAAGRAASIAALVRPVLAAIKRVDLIAVLVAIRSHRFPSVVGR
jgi:hypothetical protein